MHKLFERVSGLFEVRNTEHGLFPLVMALGAVACAAAWTSSYLKGVNTPIGLWGTPVLAAVLAVAAFLLQTRVGPRAWIQGIAYFSICAYLQVQFAWLMFADNPPLGTVSALLQYMPALYVVGHTCLQRHATKAACLNYLGLLVTCGSATLTGVMHDDVRSAMVLAAVFGHPAYIASLHFILLLRRRAFHLAQREVALSRQADTDGLTGLSNRSALHRLFDTDGQRCAQAAAPACALMVIDVDHFKRVNDTLGHSAGDEVLCQVASVIANCVRPADVAGRWGGEEFVVLLNTPEEDPGQVAVSVARRIAKACASVSPGGGLPCVSVSIGLALRREGQASLQDLFETADQRVYRAKAAGRARLVGEGDKAEVLQVTSPEASRGGCKGAEPFARADQVARC